MCVKKGGGVERSYTERQRQRRKQRERSWREVTLTVPIMHRPPKLTCKQRRRFHRVDLRYHRRHHRHRYPYY